MPFTGITERATYGDSEILNICSPAQAGITTTARLDDQAFTPCQPYELWRLPLGMHYLVITERNAAGDVVGRQSVTFTTKSSFADMFTLLDRFEHARRDHGGRRGEPARPARPRVHAVPAGRTDPVIDYLEQFIARAENQIKGNMDQAAKAALIRDAQYVIAQIRAGNRGNV